MNKTDISNVVIWKICTQSAICDDFSLSSSSRLLVLIICAYFNHIHGFCFPSINTLKKSSNLSSPTINRCVKELIAKKILKVGKIRTNGRDNNQYSFTDEFLEQIRKYKSGKFLTIPKEPDFNLLEE